ncbi:MAG: prolipoprotein diacylglyceryl transferase [Lachnospiraceae bacterium]|nr:prolipoprotein diacylglyceryl transferase [Lachnospiraceae bacterium]
MAIDLFSIGRFTVHGYGLMIGIGFLLGVLIGNYRAKLRGLSPDHLTNIAIFVLLFGFMGGKLLFIIVEYKDFFTDPLGALGSEGFVVYGGIITGILTIMIYCKIKKISTLTYMDLFVPSVAINQGIGRIGCFLAGCCYGRETDSPIGVVFPEGCLAPAGVKLIPTQLFSAAGMLLIAVGLILYARKAKYRGTVTGYYLLSYSIGRFIIEFFRNDYRGSVGVLSTSQFISIFIFVLASAILVISYHKKIPVEYRPLLKDAPAPETAEESGSEPDSQD